MNLTDPQFLKRDDLNGYLVTHTCACGHVTKGEIEAADLFRWRQGATAAAAFPYLSTTQNEALFISGICGFCWDNLFGHDDEDEEDEDHGYSQSGEEFMADYLNSDSNINYLNG